MLYLWTLTLVWALSGGTKSSSHASPHLSSDSAFRLLCCTCCKFIKPRFLKLWVAAHSEARFSGGAFGNEAPARETFPEFFSWKYGHILELAVGVGKLSVLSPCSLIRTCNSVQNCGRRRITKPLKHKRVRGREKLREKWDTFHCVEAFKRHIYTNPVRTSQGKQ
jgi:hypothetical protein